MLKELYLEVGLSTVVAFSLLFQQPRARIFALPLPNVWQLKSRAKCSYVLRQECFISIALQLNPINSGLYYKNYDGVITMSYTSKETSMNAHHRNLHSSVRRRNYAVVIVIIQATVCWFYNWHWLQRQGFNFSISSLLIFLGVNALRKILKGW